MTQIVTRHALLRPRVREILERVFTFPYAVVPAATVTIQQRLIERFVFLACHGQAIDVLQFLRRQQALSAALAVGFMLRVQLTAPVILGPPHPHQSRLPSRCTTQNSHRVRPLPSTI